ncbi:hypothetical protein PIB30_076505 [Stylosanthes scabra]|uniref:Uncharacterized protein n=1 Tax=Stylosanthes scabra TaxID=79078 RepID=A0ABU6ZNW5_9FABA|nr:hypothetical protein [Stylosanthes scabra]
MPGTSARYYDVASAECDQGHGAVAPGYRAGTRHHARAPLGCALARSYVASSAECNQGHDADAPWDRADAPYACMRLAGRADARQASLLPLGMVLHQVAVQLLVVVESSLESL